MRKKKTEKKEQNQTKKNIIFHILAVVIISIFCVAVSPVTLQNDTYYTVRIGEHIVETETVDMQDPFSEHEGLPYTYPHWLYDLATYGIYHVFGFRGIYVATVWMAILLGLSIYYCNVRLSKNKFISLAVALGSMYLMKSFIAARAQLVTFLLFVLTVYNIEKFLQTKKKRYAITLIIIPILIANLHAAVWPFYFVLYLPYLAEFAISAFMDSYWWFKLSLTGKKRRLERLYKNREKNKKKIEKLTSSVDSTQSAMDRFKLSREKAKANPYKIRIGDNKNVKWLILILIICLFTGLLTPIGDTPYTYLIKTMQGNTTSSINEHLPLTLANNTGAIVVLLIFIALLMFTDTKIRMRDLFMLGGLIFLSFMSRRQFSMLVIIGGFILVRMVTDLLNKYDPQGLKPVENFLTTWIGRVLALVYMFIVAFYFIQPKLDQKIVDERAYPVEACTYIQANVDMENMKLYNEYNNGSYILYRGIPVFIDSRCDLYTPEFNGKKNAEGKYEGRDIFSDAINMNSLSVDYEKKFEEYGITHLLIGANTKLNKVLKKDTQYHELYADKYFVVYERIPEKVEEEINE